MLILLKFSEVNSVTFHLMCLSWMIILSVSLNQCVNINDWLLTVENIDSAVFS
jgi:hypothetical protein